MYDSLTQLPNRELFTDRVSHALARRKKSGYPVGVVFIRLEDFELINDSLGRPAGKQLLRAVADRLRHLARVRDTVAYIGSDSFGILCDTAYGGQYRINTVGRVRKSFEEPFDLEGEQVYAAARIGTAVGALGADEHPETLILRAEAGAYERELEKSFPLSTDLERAREEFTQLLRAVSHDFAEPLQIVLTYAELLGSRPAGQLDQKEERYLAGIRAGAERIRELLDGLHALSRLERHVPELTEVECSEILEQTLEELAGSIEDAGATVTVEPLPTIRGDPLELGRLFENLLDNAIKFTADRRSPADPRLG